MGNKLNFSWSLNIGHVLTILTLLGGFVHAHYKFRTEFAVLKSQFENVQRTQHQHAADITELARKQVETMLKIERYIRNLP